MPKIIHRRDPAGIVASNVYDVDKDTNVLDWLSKTFTSQDELCGNLACSFWLNNKEIFRNDHDNVDESLLDFTLGENDSLVIINRPALTAVGWAIVVAVVSLAASVITYLSMPKLPGAEDARNESPNNRLNAASNQFRPGQGIPECFGYGVSYPDFIQPSYYYYENNIKNQIGVFCISAGEVIVDEVRVGDTDITDIPASSATVYTPGNKPLDKYLVIHQAATNVDGQILVAPDSDTLVRPDISLNLIDLGGAKVQVKADLADVQDLELSSSSYLYIRSPSFNGVFPIISISYVGSFGYVIVNTLSFGTYTGPADVTGTIGRGSPDGFIGGGFAGYLDYYIGWFDTPGEAAEEIYIHWQAPLGVRASGGGTITLAVRFEIENIATSVRFTKDVSITKNTLDPQFITTIFAKSEFPGMVPAQYRVRARRLTDVIDSSGNASEQLKVEGYVSVTPYSVDDFGDCTTLLVKRRATLFSPDQSSQKINLDYRRKLPYYNRVTDDYETSNLQPTNSFADAAAYTLISSGGETESSVNLAELYGIYDGLSDSRLGGFTFTFDDADLSKGERVEAICNVARTVGFHDGQQWRFARDEAKPVSSAMFNRRSVTGNNAKQAWQPQRDDDADSVRIIYVDDETNTEAYAERAFNTGTGEITSGDIGAIPIEIKLAGCRDEYQAANRADLEIRRVAYQRRSVNETTYRDALELELLDRVSWVDINDIDTFDGEILGISGDDYDTSERFVPEAGKSYVVFLTDDEGYPSNTVTCDPRVDTEFGFTAIGISGAYTATGDQQIGSRYFIADADDLASSNFTLKSRTPAADGTVEIELVEYRPEMYERDSALPPEAAPIIGNGLIALDVAQDGETASSILTFANNGQISLNGTNALWYSGGVTTSIGDSFEIYATLISGSVTSGTFGSWITLDADTSWQLDRVATVGVSECVIEFTIRQIDYVENTVTNQIGINAVVAAAVSLPASITIETDASIEFGQARIDFLSDGQWQASDATGGTYTTVAEFIGQFYELQATNLVGTLDIGEVDTWITLEGSGASFAVTASTTETVTFDLELREIADPLNTTTCAVTLTVTYPV
jgi:nitrate reductase NapE component